MASAWQTMQWVTSFLDVDDAGGGYPPYSNPSASMAGGTEASFVNTVLSDRGMVATIGLSVMFLGLGLVYYATVYATKMVSWFFRFIWKLALALVLTILVTALLSMLVPWAWAGCAVMLGLGGAGSRQGQSPFEGVDPADTVYVYMSDGTLHPIPKWSEIGTRERTSRQTDAQWGFLDRVLGFKPWSTAAGAGFWGTILGFNGETESPHVAKAIVNAGSSDLAWGGTKLAGQFLLSFCTHVGRGAVMRAMDLWTLAASSAAPAAEEPEW